MVKGSQLRCVPTAKEVHPSVAASSHKHPASAERDGVIKSKSMPEATGVVASGDLSPEVTATGRAAATSTQEITERRTNATSKRDSIGLSDFVPTNEEIKVLKRARLQKLIDEANAPLRSELSPVTNGGMLIERKSSLSEPRYEKYKKSGEEEVLNVDQNAMSAKFSDMSDKGEVKQKEHPVLRNIGSAKLRQPEGFAGSSFDRIKVWIPQMHNYLTHSTTPESEWVGVAQSYLLGQAQQVWQHALQGIYETPIPFSKFKEVLVKRYGPYDPERTARRDLRHIKQDGMSGMEYDRAFRTILADIDNPDERTVIDCYIEGLQPELRKCCDFDNRTYKPWASLDALSDFVRMRDSCASSR